MDACNQFLLFPMQKKTTISPVSATLTPPYGCQHLGCSLWALEVQDVQEIGKISKQIRKSGINSCCRVANQHLLKLQPLLQPAQHWNAVPPCLPSATRRFLTSRPPQPAFWVILHFSSTWKGVNNQIYSNLSNLLKNQKSLTDLIHLSMIWSNLSLRSPTNEAIWTAASGRASKMISNTWAAHPAAFKPTPKDPRDVPRPPAPMGQVKRYKSKPRCDCWSHICSFEKDGNSHLDHGWYLNSTSKHSYHGSWMIMDHFSQVLIIYIYIYNLY